MSDPRTSEPWFPDLCRLHRVGTLLGLAELAVVVVMLAPDGTRGWDAVAFMRASGFALWLALTVSVLLCRMRRNLSRWPPRSGSLLAVALASLVAIVAAGIVHALFASVDSEGGLPGFWPFVGGSAAIVALITALALRYFYVIDGWRAQVNANARAQADALQARIRPHFLFNSMNLIASLLRSQPAVAERAVLDLSDLFRAALDAGEGNSSLAEEVELAERYLAIESLRLGERLSIAWRKQEPLPWSLPMPRLTLQPLVENAVLHGISRLSEGGRVDIELETGEGVLRIRVRNPAPPPEAPADNGNGAGHAQRNIGHRLAYAFGPRARMTAGWAEGYYDCELSLPLGYARRP
ncbi:two-component system sensor histidine kinase AlgZ [Luteimonas cucumeris]|uniref:Two-component system sensor histidine kinase AlgZ n=1 Tax=Luteimonas cucumeris TaxID=985012 RepID=A0A562L2A0_9GAMM|nr:histidine kinase [Luteimonas cucumeris]TWI01751.1 two-component system sensor histidine kinase AlgZ [Luteimonas cucumeris]